MAAYRFTEPSPVEKELPPACSEECIWYEPEEGKLTCANRHEIICSLRRMEIFKQKEVNSKP